MFNLQGGEIIIILLLALVVLGPEKLPEAMRKMGQAYSELRKMSSGFQSEFRAAVDEPLREIRDTANTLRDSADFTKLQDGERTEKPKSAEMSTAGDEITEPVAETPDFEKPPAEAGEHEPELAEDSKPAPFSQNSSAAPRTSTEPTPVPAPPAPFTGMSSAAPRPEDALDVADDAAGEAVDAGGTGGRGSDALSDAYDDLDADGTSDQGPGADETSRPAT